ncbi:hypothetical protein D6C91_09610 [Aureobasidium pullulans]|uniref:4'-phosphopantetheinyl transferase domain-containing protein n=1 Tax=Aureobasidium pullulans TaxID=5580 RepID=A0A4S9SJB3_AURPU|nr:hypothetical protein D6C91_09610 [Aureobasidium pullulans]
MPPRPFPLALNIGTDVCHTARFKKYFIQHPTWAAKEAIIKAYAPKRRLLLRDIEIRRNSTTREPYGIVLDTPPPSRKGLSSAKFIYKAILEKEALNQPSTLPIEHQQQQRSSAQSIEQQQQQASRILSDEGILDLNAVTAALNHPSTSTSPSPTPNLIKKHLARETETSTATDKALKLQMENAKEALELVDVQGEIVKVSISHDGEYCVATALAAL